MRKIFPAYLLSACLLSCSGNQNEKTAPSEIKLLPSPASDTCAEPYLFSGKNGTVYLSWIERKEKESSLKFARLDGDQWSAPTVIATGNNWFVNWADYPVLSTLDDNSMIAHYLQKSDTQTFSYDIKLVSSVNGGRNWNAPYTLHDDGKPAEHGFVSMMPYGNQYFLSWLDGRHAAMEAGAGHEGHHGQMTLRGAMVSATGIKEQEWELDNRVCDCCQTGVAITANGPVVVYRDRSEEEIRDISIVRFIEGKWTAPQTIFADNWKIAGCPVNGPRVDALGNHLAIAWFSMHDKEGQVNLVFSHDGGATFSKPVRIDEGNTIGRVDVVMIDETSAFVSWMEGPEIKAVKVHAGGKKEIPVMIASSSASRSSGFPQMTRAGNRLLFAWTDDKEKTIKAAGLSLK